MATRSPLPVTRAILLADMVMTEALTHKKSIIGVYSRIAAPRLPVRKVLHVYAQLADAQGEYTFGMELAHLASGQILSRGEFGPVRAEDPLQPLEIVMRLPCKFTEFGAHEIRLTHEGNVFASRVFDVLQPPAGAPPPFGAVDLDDEE